MRPRRLLAAALVSLFLLPVAANAADKARLPYSPIGWESLAWYVGKDGGYYDKYGIDAEIFFQGASSEIIQAMLAGDAQFAGIGGPAVPLHPFSGGGPRQTRAAEKR